MQRVQLRNKVPDAAMLSRKGTAVTMADVSLLITGDASVYRPDGAPLCILKRAALPAEHTEAAHAALQPLRNRMTDNRGQYGGGHRQAGRLREDGLVSHQNRTVDEEGKVVSVASSVIGYYPRYPRIPFCRETAYTAKEVEKWTACQPMIRAAAELFKDTLPERYAKQAEVAARTTQAFVIPQTPFTTLTVNFNVVASIHKDAGDYKDGMGIISVIRRGVYAGHLLVFPQYGVGVDLQDRDVLFFNSHDWHGNTAVTDAQEGYERISLVYYHRADMLDCLSLAGELERAKEHGGKGVGSRKQA